MTETRAQPGSDAALSVIGLVALVLLVLSPMLVDRSGPDPYYKGPLIYPQIVLSLIVLAALAPAWRSLRAPRGFRNWQGMPRRSLGVFAIMCLYPIGISAIGLAAASFIAIFAGLVTAGRRKREALIIAMIFAAVLWGLFRGVLDIWFPSPWLFDVLKG